MARTAKHASISSIQSRSSRECNSRHSLPQDVLAPTRDSLYKDEMKAVAVFPQSHEVKVIADHPEPQISAPTEVKLRMLEVGVCGTDKEICHFDYGQPPVGSDYLV